MDIVLLICLLTSDMTNILKVILISAYSILLLQYLKISLTSRKVDVIHLEYIFPTPGTLKKIQRDLKKHRKNVTAIKLGFTRPERLQTDLKYILKWTEAFSHYSSSVFKLGQNAFIENGCVHYNCFMTNDKSLLVDHRYFDAILFDVENNWDYHPLWRAPHQKYIFTASESASNYPLCHPYFESYYNFTWTYKLDSDIRWSYINIFDKKGNLLGPKMNMTWIEPMEPTSENVIKSLVYKRKAAAWFVSHCNSKSKREHVANELAKALMKYNLKIDIYGWCGKLTCPRDRIDECLDLLERDYYFYLAFENSLSEDYVTEKVLYPLLHYTVPIVYGGANYSRFLPPGSYIDAGKLHALTVASLISTAIKNPEVYRNYFRWHNHYVYKEAPNVPDICTLCQMLNDPKQNYSVVKNFRKWWNPDYEKICKDEYKGVQFKENI